MTTHTVKSLAEYLGVSEPAIHRMIADGTIRATNVARRLGGRPSWRISPAALAAFEQARSSTPTPAPMPSRTRRTKRPTDVVAFY